MQSQRKQCCEISLMHRSIDIDSIYLPKVYTIYGIDAHDTKVYETVLSINTPLYQGTVTDSQ